MKFCKKLVNFSLLLFSFFTPLQATAYDEEPLDHRLVRGLQACQQNNPHAMQEFANPGDVALLASFFRANSSYQLPGTHFGVYLHSQNLLVLRQQIFSALIGEILQRHHQRVDHNAPGVSNANPYKAATEEMLALRERALRIASLGAYPSATTSDLGVHLTTLARDAAHLLFDPNNQRAIALEFSNPLPKKVFDGYVGAVMTLIDMLESWQPFAEDGESTTKPAEERPPKGEGADSASIPVEERPPSWRDYVIVDDRVAINFENAQHDLARNMLESLLASNHRHHTPRVVDQLVPLIDLGPEMLRLEFDLIASRSPLPQVRQLAYLMSAMLENYESLFRLRGDAEARQSFDLAVEELPFFEYRRLFEEIASGKLNVEPDSREAEILRLIQRMRDPNLWLGTDERTLIDRQRLITETWGEREIERLAAIEREKFGVSTLHDRPNTILAAAPAGFFDARQKFFVTFLPNKDASSTKSKPIGVHDVVLLTAAGVSLLDKPLADLLIDRGDGTFRVRPEQVGATFMRLRSEMEARGTGSPKPRVAH